MTNGTNILTSLGRFQVMVYVTDIGKPLSGAVVRLSAQDNHQNILADLITDTSGQTETIELPAPPLEFSLAPVEQKPLQRYNVNIFAEGFKPVIVKVCRSYLIPYPI